MPSPVLGEYEQLHQDMIKEVMDNLNYRSTRYRLNHVIHGYRRADPLRGMEYRAAINIHDVVL